MSTQTPRFPFAGRTFEVDYGDLVATNAYAADENSLTYEITGGSLKGATATVAYEWKELDGGNFLISWQEADGSTVVHVDNFEKGFSLSFFTTPEIGSLPAFRDVARIRRPKVNARSSFH